jgi:hypothetical protein
VSDATSPVLPCSFENMRYPRIYFAAQMKFAHKISRLTSETLPSTLAHYTALEEELSGSSIQEQPNETIWKTFIQKIEDTNPEEVVDSAYNLYIQQPYAQYHARWHPKGVMRFGALGVGVNPYNLDRNRVKLHFLPRREEGSDLATARIPERKEDFRALLTWTNINYPDIRYITSSTWLHNIPNYRSLFPSVFLDRLTYQDNKYLGLWGQFVRWNGKPHTKRYYQFISELDKSHTVSEAIQAIPLKVMGATASIQEFYTWYNIGNKI